MTPKFTPAEKAVLHGLVKYPTLNDRELSEIIKTNPSTTTAVRRRLREKEVFSTKRILMAHRLGYEILAVFCGKINPRTKEDVREKLWETIRSAPPIFFSLGTTDSVFAMAYFRSYREYRGFTDAACERLGPLDFIEPTKWSWAIFSLDRSKLLNYFDYGPSVRYAFGIKEKPRINKSLEKPSKEKLRKKEEIVLRGLVNFPESPDKEVAEKIRASRQAVSSMRRRFEKKGIVRTVRIVDPLKIGFSILVFAHNKFVPLATLKKRWPQLLKITEMVPQFLNVTSNPESILFAVAPEYDTYRKVRNKALRLYAEKEYLREEPFFVLFPLSDTTIVKNLDFSGFVERVANRRAEKHSSRSY